MMRSPRPLLCMLLATAACLHCLAQVSTQEKTFQASKTEVDKALQALQASSGRLPILEGFVATAGALDRYQRGYYQYSIQVMPHGSRETGVRVTAKITAWYAGDTPAHSGYRVLDSNGRLESDLLDRLDESLNGKSVVTSPETPARKTSPPTAASSTHPSLPDNPGASSTSAFPVGRATSPALPSREQALAAKVSPSVGDQRVQQLAQEAKNLEDILHNQARPQNLVSVKTSRTPIYDRPLDQAKVLFYAEAEDEFQLVDSAGAWVHVQISGISRGWVKRDHVTLPGDTPAGAAPAGESAGKGDRVEAKSVPFQPTREENSMFPGNWSVLRGKTVKIIWVQPTPGSGASQASKIEFAKSVFRKSYPQLSETKPTLAGVVIVFDSEDGGMAATTTAALQQWNAGHLSDSAFWKQCWLDPADAFREKP
jgi:hypothetical protein